MVLVNVQQEQLLVQQLKKYCSLCKYCFDRHVTISVFNRISTINDDKCDICHGLMSQSDSIIEKTVATIIDKNYEFDTFLIGATLPAQLYEREDQIRSRFKIRGKENIKKQLTRILGAKFAKITRRRVDYIIPDIVINLFINKQNYVDITIKARSVIVAGRYLKKCRGLPQKQTKCRECIGKGCVVCDNSGLSGYNSVEGIIAKELMSITKGQNPKFLWIGSEDHDSLVLGKGRPFFVRISNPKIRTFKRNLKVGSDGIYAIINGKLDSLPDSLIQFITKTKILVQSETPLVKDSLKKLNTLGESAIEFESKSKMVKKKIYYLSAKKINDNRFSLTIVADSGITIKQLVGGQEYMKPNVSEIIGTKCECIWFDILDVQIQ
ncbi:MAG TPA: tRNA pseudouridine(54/55) synthase Pus10 [Nitrososphaeraceae archaeon]|nr:tRNA pseudouridine(54/55) synthase Pus10 [Nitrososphaeraceae archaeon]